MKSSRASRSTSYGNDVNTRLHTLRGEHFRHSQNLLNSRSHLSSTSRLLPLSRTPTTGTLPTELVLPSDSSPLFSYSIVDEEDDDHIPKDVHVRDTPTTSSTSDLPKTIANCPGPGPPKSWTLITNQKDTHETPDWRLKALSLVLPDLNDTTSVPPLTQLCLRDLALLPDGIFNEYVLPWLQSHLKARLLRDSAVWNPVSSPRLYAMCGSDRNINGELIIIGPQASLREGFVQSNSQVIGPIGEKKVEEDWDLDSSMHDSPPLHTIILISTRLTISSLLSFPRTLTHVALVHLPSPIPVHRLPPLYPHIVILDLSYNTWLGYKLPSDHGATIDCIGASILDRVDWSRWRELKILGLRECSVSVNIIKRINERRWDEIDVVME